MSSSKKPTQLRGLSIDGKLPISSLVVGYAEDIGHKKEQQDVVFAEKGSMGGILPQPQVLIGVLDGHGECGRDMSRIACEKIREFLEQEVRKASTLSDPETRKEQLKSAFLQTHQSLYDTSDAEISGTTATLAWIFDDRAYFANVGDSSLALARVDPESKQLVANFMSIDHRPEREDERVRIEAMGGRVAQARPWGKPDAPPRGPFRVYQKDCDFPGLMVSRSLGDKAAHECGCSAEPYIVEHAWQKGDAMVILASDGLWDVISPQDACELAAEYIGNTPNDDSTDSAATALVKYALNNGSNDNISVAVAVMSQTANPSCCTLI